MELKLSGAQVEKLILGAFPSAKAPWLKVEEAAPGRVRVRLTYRPSMLRPGNTISGPALFVAADTAMYACVLAHIGPEVMALTANLNMHFLKAGRAADILAEARMLRLGRRLAVMEVSLRTGDDPEAVAHVTGSYAIPARTTAQAPA